MVTVKAINEIREELHDAGVKDRMRELSRGEHADMSEALEHESEPEQASWDDIELQMLSKPGWARRIRERVADRAGLWAQRVCAEWLAKAAAIEADHAQHVSSAGHAQWLQCGGPARVWDALQKRRNAAQQTADRIAVGPVADGARFDAELAKWQQEELVRQFLKEDAG